MVKTSAYISLAKSLSRLILPSVLFALSFLFSFAQNPFHSTFDGGNNPYFSASSHQSIVISGPLFSGPFNHSQSPIESEPSTNESSDNDEKEEDVKDELQKLLSLHLKSLSGLLTANTFTYSAVSRRLLSPVNISRVILFHSWKTHLS